LLKRLAQIERVGSVFHSWPDRLPGRQSRPKRIQSRGSAVQAWRDDLSRL